MARPNPDWPGNAALGAAPEFVGANTVSGGTFEASTVPTALTLTMSPAMAHIVRCAVVTSEVPGPLMEEASSLIAMLHLFAQGQMNG